MMHETHKPKLRFQSPKGELNF
uniref:Uncharacterized protein n=1 Tax=Anguilla anguilla TaxID=7936 RepID=A0A0E9TYN8_ANGAN